MPTSAGSGLWTAGASWVGGIPPVNGDVVVIAAGHDIEYDADMTAWANGVYKTTDGGQTWTPANRGLLDRSITALAINPTNPQTVYAGTFEGEVFVSVDGGGAGSEHLHFDVSCTDILADNPGHWPGGGAEGRASVIANYVDPKQFLRQYHDGVGFPPEADCPGGGNVP